MTFLDHRELWHRILTADSHLLLGSALLLGSLLLEVLLLSLCVEALELSVALSLLRLFAIGGALLKLLLLDGLLDLVDLGVTRHAQLLENLGAEARAVDDSVRHADGVRQQGSEIVVVVGRGQVVLEVDALARSRLVESGGLLERLVGDDKVVKVLASGGDGVDELLGEQGVGDFSALAHNGKPGRELGVVLGGGQGDVVALVAELLHARLVDESPDEAVESALVVTHGLVGHAAQSGDRQVLLAVEGVHSDLGGVLGRAKHVAGEAGGRLDQVHDGVVTLGQLDVDVDKGHVLAAGSVRGELRQRALLHQVIVVGVLALAVGSKQGELLAQSCHVAADPGADFVAVRAGTEEVQRKNGDSDQQDEAFGLELGQRVALVDVVPFGVGRRRGLGQRAHDLGGTSSSGSGSWVRGSSEIGKVCRRAIDG